MHSRCNGRGTCPRRGTGALQRTPPLLRLRCSDSSRARWRHARLIGPLPPPRSWRHSNALSAPREQSVYTALSRDLAELRSGLGIADSEFAIWNSSRLFHSQSLILDSFARRANIASPALFGSFPSPRAIVACAATRSPARIWASASEVIRRISVGLEAEACVSQWTAVSGSFRRSDRDAIRAAR